MVTFIEQILLNVILAYLNNGLSISNLKVMPKSNIVIVNSGMFQNWRGQLYMTKFVK